ALSARPSLPRLTIAVGVTQLAFHAAFSTLGEAAIASAPHVHGVIEVGAPAHSHVDSPLMWLSHAAAGVVTLVLLRGAETAAWRLLAEFARLVLAPFSVPVPLPALARPITTPAGRVVSLTARLLDRAVSRRGPPLSHA
ncbi:MAG TPA: hypothetical protein VL294_07955, partial [Pseudolysinimonas sp.]|nr:hypothetical protein [Pseudolysinimonas sp.]